MSDETTGKRRVKACRFIRSTFNEIGWDADWSKVVDHTLKHIPAESQEARDITQELVEQVRKRRSYAKADDKDPLSRVTARHMITLQKLVDDVGGWEVLLAVAEEMVGMPE